MRLRKFEEKDAQLMLEWMHDDSVVHFMQADFASKTIDDCKSFISAAQDTSKNVHLAIVDDFDEYMGTVSLKNIHDGSAEFAITIRKCAMGKGYSSWGMKKLINEGLNHGLHQIYWCVAPENKRAVKFYDKNSYRRTNAPKGVKGYSKEQVDHYIWYEYRLAEKILHDSLLFYQRNGRLEAAGYISKARISLTEDTFYLIEDKCKNKNYSGLADIIQKAIDDHADNIDGFVNARVNTLL